MDDNFPKTERQQQAVNQAKKVFLVLLASGLSIGVIVSIGVIKLMNYFGLTEKTNQLEIIREKID
ncbi:hypothetical protein [Crocosphaera sp.]|uniref:hypothetical protein n=1 Tax=Crocosphaera sp. TaxID=2729996 RepID=UPI003F293940|nr:hypothetical protein [Crocosphaera sp.]